MIIEYDKNKSDRNAKERNLPFDMAAGIEWDTAIIESDNRKNYPEKRFVMYGLLNDRLHMPCFSHVPKGIRIISFRKANNGEVKKYERKRQADDR